MKVFKPKYAEQKSVTSKMKKGGMAKPKKMSYGGMAKKMGKGGMSKKAC